MRGFLVRANFETSDAPFATGEAGGGERRGAGIAPRRETTRGVYAEAKRLRVQEGSRLVGPRSFLGLGDGSRRGATELSRLKEEVFGVAILSEEEEKGGRRLPLKRDGCSDIAECVTARTRI
jgi:hypothetical protein